ncbi:MAG: extracellular solute-binding protein [Deltaproteobacteria bacterium]|nr:extracellular solute-binding protein [Deltaproteobacteria bacterium]
MRKGRFLMVGLALVLGLTLGAGQTIGAPVDDLVAAAKKEGVIEMLAPSTLTPKGGQALIDALNQRYGLNIKLSYHPSANMTGDVAKVIGRAASGVSPEWDIMIVTDSHHGSLWLRKQHTIYDYKKLGIDPQLVHYDSGAVSFANQIILPAYNQKILPAKDVPKRWEDILDPKWKAKIGVPHSVHHFARLAAGPWGEEKTTQFVKRLAALEPFIGTPAQMYTRLQLGEILLVSNIQDSFIHQAVRKGAPLAQAHGIEPVPSPAYHVGVLKGAPHPNVGHLFAAFMTTPEAQKLWEKYSGHTSAFVPGTEVYNYAQKHKMVFMTQDQAEMVDKLTAAYVKIMGFTR